MASIGLSTLEVSCSSFPLLCSIDKLVKRVSKHEALRGHRATCQPKFLQVVQIQVFPKVRSTWFSCLLFSFGSRFPLADALHQVDAPAGGHQVPEPKGRTTGSQVEIGASAKRAPPEKSPESLPKNLLKPGSFSKTERQTGEQPD